MKKSNLAKLFLACGVMLSSTAVFAQDSTTILHNKDGIVLKLNGDNKGNFEVVVENNTEKDIFDVKLFSKDIKGLKLKNGGELSIGNLKAKEKKVLDKKELQFEIDKAVTEAIQNQKLVKTGIAGVSKVLIPISIAGMVGTVYVLVSDKKKSKKFLSLAISAGILGTALLGTNVSADNAYDHNENVSGKIVVNGKDYEYVGVLAWNDTDKNQVEKPNSETTENENTKPNVEPEKPNVEPEKPTPEPEKPTPEPEKPKEKEEIKKAKEELKAYIDSVRKETLEMDAINSETNKEAIKKIKEKLKRAEELLNDENINEEELKEINSLPYKKVGDKKTGEFRSLAKKILVDFEVLGEKSFENIHNHKKYTKLENNKIIIKTTVENAKKFKEDENAYLKLNYVTEEEYNSKTEADAVSGATPKYNKKEINPDDYKVKKIEGGYEIEISKLPENAKIIKPIIYVKFANGTYFENGTLVFIEKENSEDDEILKKLNENESLKMRLNLMLEKDDVNSDITKKELENVTDLNFSSENIKDYSFLKLCKNLESLDLGNQQGEFDDSDLANIKDFKNLRKLILAGNPKISDLTNISNLVNLEVLKINETSVTSIEPISKLIKLKELSAFELAEDEEGVNFNFNALSNFTEMEKLDITEIPLENLSFVSNMKKLKKLAIDNCGVSDLSELKSATSLETLKAKNNKLTTIDGLEKLVNLKDLELENNAIVDISKLSTLTNLEELNLNNNKLESIQSVSNLKNLKILKFNKNKVENINSISELVKLIELSFDNNSVNSLDSLKKLTSLKSLSAMNNKITSLESVDNLATLEEVRLVGNSVENVANTNLWKKDKSLNVEKQEIAKEINVNDLSQAIDLLGEENNYTLETEDINLKIVNGKLKVENGFDTKKEVVINFENKNNTYNKTHSGKITIKFVGEKNEELKIVSFDEIDTVEIPYGANKDSYMSKLPKIAKANLSNGTKVDVNLKEYKGYINTWSSGETKVSLDYDLPEGVTGEKKDLIVKIKVLPKPAEAQVQLDKESYYYKDNPVLTLKNFPDGEVEVLENKEYDDKKLKENVEYTYDAVNKTVTINTHAILKVSGQTLSTDRTLDITVKVGTTQKMITIRYLKDKSMYPWPDRYDDVERNGIAKIEMIIDDKADYPKIKAFVGTNPIIGAVVKDEMIDGEEKTFLSIPYESVKTLIKENKLEITIRCDGYKDQKATLNYKPEAIKKEWNVEAVVNENDGTTPKGVAIYPYNGEASMKIKVTGNGITDEYLRKNLVVKIKSANEAEFTVPKSNIGAWRITNYKDLLICVPTDQIDGEIIWRKDSNWEEGQDSKEGYEGRHPITKITLELEGYETKTVNFCISQ